jgi:hypothetical protein
MQLHAGDKLLLLDAQQHDVGHILLEGSEGGLLHGKFTPGADFAAVKDLFRRFEAAVDSQALSVVDELDTAIAALGLRLESVDRSQSVPIHDVQIWNDGNVTCRLCGSTLPGANSHRGIPAAAHSLPEEQVRK